MIYGSTEFVNSLVRDGDSKLFYWKNENFL